MRRLAPSVLCEFGGCVIMCVLIHRCILVNYSFFIIEYLFFHHFILTLKHSFFDIISHFNFNFFASFLFAASVVTFVSSIDALFGLFYQI